MRNTVIFLFALLYGCASSYTPSENFTKLKTSMTREKALTIISSNIAASSNYKGLCRSFHEGNPFPDAESAKMEGSIIVYSSWETKDWGTARLTGNIKDGTSSLDVYRNFKKATFRIDISKLKTIRILKDDKGGFQCSNSKDAYLVILRKEMKEEVAVELGPQHLESFIAAVSYMSPNAKIISGFGF